MTDRNAEPTKADRDERKTPEQIAEDVVNSVEWIMDNFLPAKGESGDLCYRRRYKSAIAEAITDDRLASQPSAGAVEYFGLPMSDDDLTKHYEASKRDAVSLVGSEVRQMVAEIRAYRKAALAQAPASEQVFELPLVFYDGSDLKMRIAGLAKALEQGDGRVSICKWQTLISDLNAALATNRIASEEPVAWMYRDTDGEYVDLRHTKAGVGEYPYWTENPLYASPTIAKIATVAAPPAATEAREGALKILFDAADNIADHHDGGWGLTREVVDAAKAALAASATPSDDQQLIERIAKAMQNAVIKDDEGEFPRLFDLLDFSGENNARTVVRGLARAALEEINRCEYICTCGIRVSPHRCNTVEGF